MRFLPHFLKPALMSVHTSRSFSINGGKVFYTFPNAETFLEDFDQFIYHHDEPPGCMSQYAAWCVMRLAREHGVPVLLNGQGGDEVFSGYWPAYYLFLRQHSARFPLHVVQHLLGALLRWKSHASFADASPLLPVSTSKQAT